MSGGPRMAARLDRLARPPCSSPCAFGGICCDMSAFKRRPAHRRQAPEHDADVQNPAVRRKGITAVDRRATQQSDQRGAPFTAELRDQHARQAALADRHDDARRCERQTDCCFRPPEAQHRVEGPGARQNLVSEQPQEGHAGEGDHDWLLAQLHERPERIRARPFERTPSLARQRLRQSEQPEGRVQQRQSRGDEEGRARPQRAEQAADRRPEHEAEAEGSADEPEALRALFRRSDVGDVGVRGGIRRAGDSRDEAADEQPRKSRGQSHDDIVDAEREQRRQQHGSPAETIAEIAHERRAEELRDRVDEVQPAAVAGSLAQAFAGELHDQLGHHRDDDPEADRVDQDRDEDEEDGMTMRHGRECRPDRPLRNCKFPQPRPFSRAD